MNGNADLSSSSSTEQGHIVNQAGPGKGDYRMVGINEEDEHPSMKAISASKPGAGLLSVPETQSHPALSIASYCAASILMTVVNKVGRNLLSIMFKQCLQSIHSNVLLTDYIVYVFQFVLSGHHFTMNFLLLTIQSLVCVACVVTCKRMKVCYSAMSR